MRKWRFRHPPDVRFIGLRLSMTGGWRRSARACGFCLPIAPTSIPSSRVRQDQGAAARQSHSCAPSRRSGTSSHDRGLRDSGGVQKFHTPRRLCPVRTKVLVSGDPDGGCDRLQLQSLAQSEGLHLRRWPKFWCPVPLRAASIAANGRRGRPASHRHIWFKTAETRISHSARRPVGRSAIERRRSPRAVAPGPC